jgi:hypothetical protein
MVVFCYLASHFGKKFSNDAQLTQIENYNKTILDCVNSNCVMVETQDCVPKQKLCLPQFLHG